MLEHSIILKTHLNNTFSKPNFIANFSENLRDSCYVDSSTVLDLCRRYSCLCKDMQSLSSLSFFLWQTDPSGETRKM